MGLDIYIYIYINIYTYSLQGLYLRVKCLNNPISSRSWSRFSAGKGMGLNALAAAGNTLAAGSEGAVYFWDRRSAEQLAAFDDTHAEAVTQVSRCTGLLAAQKPFEPHVDLVSGRDVSHRRQVQECQSHHPGGIVSHRSKSSSCAILLVL